MTVAILRDFRSTTLSAVSGASTIPCSVPSTFPATIVRTAQVPVGFSGAVGVFFGYYPARDASALNPIDALRYE